MWGAGWKSRAGWAGRSMVRSASTAGPAITLSLLLIPVLHRLLLRLHQPAGEVGLLLLAARRVRRRCPRRLRDRRAGRRVGGRRRGADWHVGRRLEAGRGAGLLQFVADLRLLALEAVEELRRGRFRPSGAGE